MNLSYSWSSRFKAKRIFNTAMQQSSCRVFDVSRDSQKHTNLQAILVCAKQLHLMLTQELMCILCSNPTLHAEIRVRLGRAYEGRITANPTYDNEKAIQHFEVAGTMEQGPLGATARNNAGCLIMRREYFSESTCLFSFLD